ncbi:MAG TPA: hypothetical protein VIY51_06495 [Xanthobacteraceae bacterium]
MVKPPPTFASLEGLLDHGRRDGFDIRPTLLRVLTDLYLQKPTHPLEDERYYTELALRLIGSTDVAARAAVAARLAPYPAAPRAVILRLARDVIDVAEPILRQSPCLTPADLKSIALDCGAAHAAIVAIRPSPSTPEAPDPPIAIRTGDRPPTEGAEAAELSELFFSAGAAERRLILMNLDCTARASPRVPQARAMEIVGRLETSALAHNIDAFAREIELAFGISSHLARQIARDDLGEPIVVVAKALAAPRAVLERILLFVNPRIGQSVRRVYELATHYDEISIEAALCLVSIWREAEPREQETPRPPSVLRRPPPDLGRPATPLPARRPLVREPRTRSLSR